MSTKVSHYYQSIIDQLGNNCDIDSFQEYAQTGGHTSGFENIIFNPGNNGFYGIIDDNDQKFFPINCYKTKHLLHDPRKISWTRE